MLRAFVRVKKGHLPLPSQSLSSRKEKDMTHTVKDSDLAEFVKSAINMKYSRPVNIYCGYLMSGVRKSCG